VAPAVQRQLESYLDAANRVTSTDKAARKVLIEALATSAQRQRIKSLQVEGINDFELFTGDAEELLQLLPAKICRSCISSRAARISKLWSPRRFADLGSPKFRSVVREGSTGFGPNLRVPPLSMNSFRPCLWIIVNNFCRLVDRFMPLECIALCEHNLFSTGSSAINHPLVFIHMKTKRSSKRIRERETEYTHGREKGERREKRERIDEFIRAEIENQQSLSFGSKEISAARLRAKAARDALPAGDAVSGAANWVLMGPQAIPNGQSLGGTARLLVNGRITGIAIHPTTPTTMYASGARGGVWKTTDEGLTWTPKSDNEISLAIGALALAPSAPDTLYAGTGEGNIYFLVTNSPLNSLNESYQGSGLLKSTNGGDTWTPQGATEFTGAAFYAIAVHPTDSNIAFAATTRGLYRTTNGGTNWAVLGGGLPAISASVIAASDVVIDPTDGSKAWVAFWGSGIYECSNAAAASPTWTLVTGSPTSNLSRISLAISPSSPATLFALAADGAATYKAVYRTTGGIGGTWSQLTYGERHRLLLRRAASLRWMSRHPILSISAERASTNSFGML
jgi:hypothetical protein